MYSREKDVCSPKDTVELLMNCETYVDRSQICSAQPLRVQHNCTFIVDLGKLKDTGDIKCDDLGSWKNNGSKQFSFHLEDEGGYLFAKSVCDSDDEENKFILRREYYQLRNPTTTDFRKRIDIIISKYFVWLGSVFFISRTCYLLKHQRVKGENCKPPCLVLPV